MMKTPSDGTSVETQFSQGEDKIRNKKKPPRIIEAASEYLVSTGATPGLRFYFFDVFTLRFSSMAAWAAARRATGTRKGEQLT